MAQGEIPEPFQIREGDFFVETAEELNRVLQRLREKRELVEGFEKKLEEAFKRNLASSQMPLLNELKESLSKLM